MDQPAKVGRYHIVGHLASGGMADIFLGKLLGPSGFERPVVLKRILPRLVGRENVLQMFLDEARLAARIQHANVVHVQELVEQDGGFYLVMEFLEGESALGLMKRAARRRDRIDPVLAAHVIAQACSGIHAAHELTSDSGESLNIVHRDISPGNVFVTYGGEVKVLDFGIAKFKAKSTETQVGKVRGKFAYMSPEQCRGKPVDRRSDIFALGTLLFELSTGRRLFARETHRLTMKAVTRAKLPPMKRLDPSYPDALVPILEKALQVAPGDRYETAARMRRDLVAFVQGQDAEELPEERLREMMAEWFPGRIEEKRALLREVRSGHVTHIPEAEVDEAVELPDADTVVTPQVIHQRSTIETPNFRPTMPDSANLPRPHASYVHTTPAEPQSASSSEPPPSAPPTAPVSAPPPPQPTPRGTSTAWLVVGAVAILAVGIGVGVAVGTSGDDAAAVSLPTVQTDATSDATSPSTRTVPVAPQRAPEDETVVFEVNIEPEGARIYLDGDYCCDTPASVQVPVGDEPVEVEVRQDGYRTMTNSYVPDSPHTIGGGLVRVNAAGPVQRRRRRRIRPTKVTPPETERGDDPFQPYD